MWKLSCFVLYLITIGNSSSHDHLSTTEISRNFRNYEKQRYRSEERRIEFVDSSEDYSPTDSDEFEGEELLGKWRNSGSALEPKWRDGDAVPLVPFDDSSRSKKLTREDATNDETTMVESSGVSEKIVNSDDRLAKINIKQDGTIEKIPMSLQYQSSSLEPKNDHYSLDENYDRQYRVSKDSRGGNNGFPLREKSNGVPITRTKNSMLYRATEESNNPGEEERNTLRIKNKEFFIGPHELSSRSRYGDTFQTHPNEYELNDEEYQKPRPRKRRPPQNYEFVETRAPTYSITWSTERYTERNLDRSSTRTMRKPETTERRRGSSDKKNNRNRAESTNMNSGRGTENAELKSLLKMQQIEGLSLSELLQRRNLTLNDLLGGKAEVLRVLKSNDNDSAEIIDVRSKIFQLNKLNDTEDRSNSKDLTNVRNSNSTLNKISKVSRSENDVISEDGRSEKEKNDSAEKMDSEESEDIKRSSNENEKLSAIVRLTKPIILPSVNFFSEKTTTGSTTNHEDAKKLSEHSEGDENMKKKSSSTLVDEDEIMEFSDFNTKIIDTATIVPEETTNYRYDIKFNDDSGSTLSIENILSTTQQTATNLPINETRIFDARVNAVAINESNSDSDILHILDYQSDEPSETIEENINEEDLIDDEEELTMSDEPYEKKIDQVSARNENIPSKNHVIFSTSSRPYELVISEIEPEARAEIFELFSTGSSAKRLERLLKSRNMSIDELIELRKRGSSKVHLAGISRLRENVNSRNYNRDDETIVDSSRDEEKRKAMIVETTTDDLSDIEIDSVSSETIDTKERRKEKNISFIGTETSQFHSTSFRDDDKNDKLFDILKVFDSLPFSIRPKTIDGEKTGQQEETEISSFVKDEVVENRKNRDNPKNLLEIGIVEEILENKDSTTNDDLAERNISANYSSISKYNEERKNSNKIRPSIIASGAILGVTFVVFLAIFIIVRIRQKQKYTYRNTFPRSVFQAPVMTARKLSNSSSLNTIMVNVVATSTSKRPERRDNREIDENFEPRSDIENDSLDANDSWETIPDFMK